MLTSSITLKDHLRETRIYTNRSIAAGFIIAILTSVLVLRMFFLQVLDHELYSTKSNDNRVHTEAISPTRGLIFDRNGTLIADNRPSYSVTIIKERVKNLDQTLIDLGEIIDLSDSELVRFRKLSKQRRRPYQPIPLHSNLTEVEIAKIAVEQYRLPGVEISAELIRHYPRKDKLAHVLGYVNRINEQDLKEIDKTNYSATNYIGRIGIEKFYESQLHGKVGYRKVETNARGRILKVLDRSPPTPGQDISLHLDLKTQEAAFNALEGRRGAVVAIDIETGGVLAMASQPSYNTNLFVSGISQTDYDIYKDNPDLPLFNRVLQGQYPPGSTIKPFLGLAFTHHNIRTWKSSIRDPGYYQLDRDERKYRDWKKRGHGTVNLFKAIEQSCDIYFYDSTFKLGIDRTHNFLSQFGFGSRTGIDIKGEVPGILPSKSWKKKYRGQSWYHGDTVITGIGQGFTLVTPLQLAVATAILAKKGEKITPQLIINERKQLPTTTQRIHLNAEEDWNKMFAAMKSVIHGTRGTARVVGRKSKYEIAGKTGTAQVKGIKQNEEYDEHATAERLKDHALFIAFAPADNPKIAVAVIVENGSHGGSTAGPVARKVLDAYLLDSKNQLKDFAKPSAMTTSEQDS